MTRVTLRAARPFLAALVLALVTAPAALAQPVAGQIDDFQNGTVMNWTNGPAPNPINISTGGPAGANDRFMQVTATGSGGSGGRLITFNRTQWAGNFSGPGITAVEMDLKELSGPTLHMRIGMKSATFQGAPGYEATTPLDLTADGLWHHRVFLLDTADLTAVNSPAALDSFLTSVAEFRILSEAGPGLTLNGDPVAAVFGVDNIHAVAPVPEPGSLLLIVAGAGFIGGAVVRARRRVRPAATAVWKVVQKSVVPS
jgi:hypothetical protein